MENALKQRITKLVQGLLLDDVTKQTLLEAISKNQIDAKLLEKIKFFIEQATVDYEAEAEKQIAKIRDDLNTTLANVEKEFSTIEQEAKQEQKEQSKRKDQEQIEDIRKSLSKS